VKPFFTQNSHWNLLLPGLASCRRLDVATGNALILRHKLLAVTVRTPLDEKVAVLFDYASFEVSSTLSHEVR